MPQIACAQLDIEPKTRPIVLGDGSYPEMAAAAIEIGDQLSDAESDAGWDEHDVSPETNSVEFKMRRDALLAAAPPLTNVNGWNLKPNHPSMIKLPTNGAVTIVPYDRAKPLMPDYHGQSQCNLPTLHNDGEWYGCSLCRFSVPPYGTVYVNFYSVDTSYCTDTKRLPSNKHIPGCRGDVYLVAHFEANEDGMRESDRNVCHDDFDSGEKVPDWLEWDFTETYGVMPSGCKIRNVWYPLLLELRFKSLYYYNRFNDASADVANSMLDTVQRIAPHFYHRWQRDFLRYNKDFHHPEAELAHTTGSMLHPGGLDVQLLRSLSALESYSQGLSDLTNDYLALAGATLRVVNKLRVEMFDGFKIDCAGIDSDVYATNISKVWEALYDRVLAQAAESTATRARRLEMHGAMMAAQEAEAKAKEQRRKLAAAESRAAKANASEAPYTSRGTPRLSQRADKKATREQRRCLGREAKTAAALAHVVYVLPEQKEYRHEAAELRKEVAHADRLAREAKETFDRLHELAKSTSAAHEAATHYVPLPATLNDMLTTALESAE